MGANMARRLNDQHFTITAISDVNSVAAKSLADELGSTYYEKLSHVTKNADVIITVVTDDKAMKGIFHSTGSCLLYTSPSPRDRQKSRMPSSA